MKVLAPAEFEMFCRYIEENSGIVVDPNRRSAFLAVACGEMRRLGIGEYRSYYNHLLNNRDEFQVLIDLVTTNETYFFRNEPHFLALQHKIIPEIMAVKRRNNLPQIIRIWSAGCSTGEEAYSIAMLIDQHFDLRGWRFEILGTDVNTEVLNKAREATYRQRALQTMPLNMRNSYFRKVDDFVWEVDTRIRRMVNFEFFNLIKEPFLNFYKRGVDIIFCRNVTIYFKERSTRRVIENFYQLMEPNGYLLIGHSETLLGINSDFVRTDLDDCIVYKKEPEPNKYAPARSSLSLPQRPKPAPEPLRQQLAPQRSAQPSGFSEAQVQSLYEAGMGFFYESNRMEALAKFKELITLKADSAIGYFMLGRIYSDGGEYVRAMGYYHKSIDINPLHLESHFLLGITCYQQRDYAHAERELRKCLYLNSEFGIGFYSLGNMYKEQGRKVEAVREYKNASACFMKNPAVSAADYFGGFPHQLLISICKRNIVELGRPA